MVNAKSQQSQLQFSTQQYTISYRCQLVKENDFPLPEKMKGTISSPGSIYEIFREYCSMLPHEEFIVVALNSHNDIIGTSIISRGILNASIVHPREVFRFLVLANAASCILVHNHPSGDCQPSADDRKVTKVIKEAGELMDISVLDHVIVGNGYFSFREEGLTF